MHKHWRWTATYATVNLPILQNYCRLFFDELVQNLSDIVNLKPVVEFNTDLTQIRMVVLEIQILRQTKKVDSDCQPLVGFKLGLVIKVSKVLS